MVITLENYGDFVYAYAEVSRVNEWGIKSEFGDYIKIGTFWIHPEKRNRFTVRDLVKKIDNHPLLKSCKYVYWTVVRNDCGEKLYGEYVKFPYRKRISKTYTRGYIVKKLTGEKRCLENCLV